MEYKEQIKCRQLIINQGSVQESLNKEETSLVILILGAKVGTVSQSANEAQRTDQRQSVANQSGTFPGVDQQTFNDVSNSVGLTFGFRKRKQYR